MSSFSLQFQGTYLYNLSLKKLKISAVLFSGGFAGKECFVETDGTTKILDFYPEDGNKNQFFYLKEVIRVKKIRFAFNSSTDFYGRITIYNLDVFS